jgi:hypothetical protein
MRSLPAGDREAAEVFFATEGLHSDLPSAKVLLRTLRILVKQFAVGMTTGLRP